MIRVQAQFSQTLLNFFTKLIWYNRSKEKVAVMTDKSSARALPPGAVGTNRAPPRPAFDDEGVVPVLRPNYTI